MEVDNYFLLKRKQKKPSIAAIGSSSPGTPSAEEAVMKIKPRDTDSSAQVSGHPLLAEAQ